MAAATGKPNESYADDSFDVIDEEPLAGAAAPPKPAAAAAMAPATAPAAVGPPAGVTTPEATTAPATAPPQAATPASQGAARPLTSAGSAAPAAVFAAVSITSEGKARAASSATTTTAASTLNMPARSPLPALQVPSSTAGASDAVSTKTTAAASENAAPKSPLEAAIDQLAAPGAQRTLTHVAAKAILEAAGGLEAVAAAILSAVDDAADDKRRLRGCAAITALCCTGAELRKQLLDACTPARGAKITPFTALQGLAAMPQSVEDAAAAAEAYAAASAAWTAAPPVDGKKGPPPAVPPTAAGLVAEAGGIGLIAIALLDAFASEHASVRKLACRAFVALTLAGPATCKALFELNVSSTCATLPLPKAVLRLAEVKEGDLLAPQHIITAAGGMRLVSIAVRVQLGSDDPEDKLLACRAFTTLFRADDDVKAQMGINPQVVKNVVTPEQATQLLADVSEADLLSRHHILSNANKHPDKGFETVVPAIFRALNAPPVPGAPAVDERKKAVRRRLAARALRTLAKEGPAMQAKLLAAGLAARLADSTPQAAVAALAASRADGVAAGGKDKPLDAAAAERIMDKSGGFGIILLTLLPRLESGNAEERLQACDAVATLAATGADMRHVLLASGFILRPPPIEPAAAVATLASKPPISHRSLLHTMHKAGGFKTLLLEIVAGLDAPDAATKDRSTYALSVLLEGAMGEEMKRKLAAWTCLTATPSLSVKQFLDAMAALEKPDGALVNDVVMKAGGFVRACGYTLRGLASRSGEARRLACNAFRLLFAFHPDMPRLVNDVSDAVTVIEEEPAAVVPELAKVQPEDPLSAQHLMEQAGGFVMVAVTMLELLGSASLATKLTACQAFAMLANRCIASLPAGAKDASEGDAVAEAAAAANAAAAAPGANGGAAAAGAAEGLPDHVYCQRIMKRAGGLEAVCAAILAGLNAETQQLRLQACHAFSALARADKKMRGLISKLGERARAAAKAAAEPAAVPGAPPQIIPKTLRPTDAIALLASFPDADHVYTAHTLSLAGGFGLVAVRLLEVLWEGDGPAKVQACAAVGTLARSSGMYRELLNGAGLTAKLAELFAGCDDGKSGDKSGDKPVAAAPLSRAGSQAGTKDTSTPATPSKPPATPADAKDAGVTPASPTAAPPPPPKLAFPLSQADVALGTAALTAAAALCTRDPANTAVLVAGGVRHAVVFALDAGEPQALLDAALAVADALWGEAAHVAAMYQLGAVAKLVDLTKQPCTQAAALRLLLGAQRAIGPAALAQHLAVAGGAATLLNILRSGEQSRGFLPALQLLVGMHVERRSGWPSAAGQPAAAFGPALALAQSRGVSAEGLHASLQALGQMAGEPAVAQAMLDAGLAHQLVDLIGSPDVVHNAMQRGFLAEALRHMARAQGGCAPVVKALTTAVRHAGTALLLPRQRAFMAALRLVALGNADACAAVESHGLLPYTVQLLGHSDGPLVEYSVALLLQMAQLCPELCGKMYKSKAVPFVCALLKSPNDEIHRDSRQLMALLIKDRDSAAAAAPPAAKAPPAAAAPMAPPAPAAVVAGR